MEVMILFFQLLIGHAVGDFVLQPSPMSAGKNRHNKLEKTYGEGFPPWYYWLSAHSLTHAGIVFVITGNALFALVEALTHWVTDYFKCERSISLHQDQALHVGVKALFCLIVLWRG
jgi:hypothetical protein